MSQAWSGSPPREQQNNVADAVSPQAILPPTEHKLPISDNDPTRNVSPSARVVGLALVLGALAALLVLAAATILVFRAR